MSVSRSDNHNLFRASHGMPALLKKTGRSGINGEQRTYYEVVLELLPK